MKAQRTTMGRMPTLAKRGARARTMATATKR